MIKGIIYRSASEVWEKILSETGLQLKRYDQGFTEAIAERIDPKNPPDLKKYKSEFKKRNITTEQLIGAFLTATKPFAMMIHDLCIFFATNKVKETNEALRMKFDFGAKIPELNFDLENFKKILKNTIFTINEFDVRLWTDSTLWQISEIFPVQRSTYPNNNREFDRWRDFFERGQFIPPDIPKPDIPTNYEELWSDVQNIWEWFVLTCYNIEPDRRTLERRGSAQRMDTSEIDEDPLLVEHEIPSVVNNDLRVISGLVHDNWPRTFGGQVYSFAERLNDPTFTSDQSVIERINNLRRYLDEQPQLKRKRKTPEERLDEILKLPIWGSRHELYSAWILSRIDHAANDYIRVVHSNDGELLLKFSGTHVWTAQSKGGHLFLWAELRSPLEKPVGKKRKTAIQPDYRINFGSVTDHIATKVVVEAKQYLYGSSKNFSDAIIDYAAGCPNATVLLANYGTIPKSLNNKIAKSIKHRVAWFDHMQPEKAENIEKFESAIRNTLPSPSPFTQIAELLEIDTVIVDVSPSMSSTLNFPSFKKDLLRLASVVGASKLVAIDTSITGIWDTNDQGAKELISSGNESSTNLGSLGGRSWGRTLVVTDESGEKTLSVEPDAIVIIKYEPSNTGINILLKR